MSKYLRLNMTQDELESSINSIKQDALIRADLFIYKMRYTDEENIAIRRLRARLYKLKNKDKVKINNKKYYNKRLEKKQILYCPACNRNYTSVNSRYLHTHTKIHLKNCKKKDMPIQCMRVIDPIN